MSTPIQSLIASGSKVWLDSIDPDEVARNRVWGITGATSNPIIIADLVKTGRLDEELDRFFREGFDDYETAWRTTDLLVSQAQEAFLPVWEATRGDDGYVSFELDPLLEDPEPPDSAERLDQEQRTQRYIELGKHWSAGRRNRMIKVPATPSGLAALEELAAAGVTVNVTLTFTPRQYVANARRIWRMNQEFWAEKGLPLKQEIVFARTGTKKPEDAPWKYVEAFAGSGIETNPPATNQKVQSSGRTFVRTVDKLGPKRWSPRSTRRSI